jgi:hypothetical protein
MRTCPDITGYNVTIPGFIEIGSLGYLFDGTQLSLDWAV